MLKALVPWVAIGGVILLLGIQVIPYGRHHTNPPARVEPAWDSTETRELTVRACFDCHSNQTVWPWYANLAPFSWLVQSDVDEGRGKVNYSEWGRPQKEAKQSAEEVQEREMPPWYYAMLHPEAQLSSSERQALIRGLEATFGREEKGEHGEEKEAHEKRSAHDPGGRFHWLGALM
ncbi:MAG: heme-binding domain-containing protein [Candidatus Methylomirabilales bacterium]